MSQHWIKFLDRVNERRYEFGDEDGADTWVCAKIPHDGAVKKDCVPKVVKLHLSRGKDKNVNHTL